MARRDERPDDLGGRANRRVWESPAAVLEYRCKDYLYPDESVVFDRYRGHFTDRRVLDVGCGAGRMTAAFRDMTRGYVGLDYAESMIRACRERFPGERFVRADMRRMDCFADAEFDVVFAGFNSLDYVDHAGRLAALGEIHRVLAGGGLFVFSAHNRRFERADSPPRLCWSAAPLPLLRNLRAYLRESRNRRRNRKREIRAAEYAILNDGEQRYALLTYYIDRRHQIAQLESAGFGLREMIAAGGEVIGPLTDDRRSPWIRYVAVRR